LSAVAQVARRGTAAVVQTRGHWHCLAGHRGSGHWCRARGGVTEFRGGPGWCFAVAQRRWHDDAVAAKVWGGKGLLTMRGAPFIAARGGWQMAV
jgi:hypothetical protein